MKRQIKKNQNVIKRCSNDVRAMTDSRKVNGRAKVCNRREHRATPGREAGVVLSSEFRVGIFVVFLLKRRFGIL